MATDITLRIGDIFAAAPNNNGGTLTVKTIDELRASNTTTGNFYITKDFDGAGWYDDGLNDGRYAPDNPSVIITANGHALIRKSLQRYDSIAVKPNGAAITDADLLTGGPLVKSGANYFLKAINDGIVSITDFGGTGNARYFDATSMGAFVDAGFTIPAHDDTQAFKDAINFINDFSFHMHTMVGGTAYGWNGGRLKLKIPTGNWYITEANLLSSLGLPGGANGGFVIEGNGPKNTVIVYNNANTGDDQYLFYDNDKYPTMIFRDFTVNGYTGKEKVFYHASQGNSQNWAIENLEIREVALGIDINGLFNADKMKVERVTYVSNQPGNSFFRIRNNSQSVAHGFYSCDVFCAGEGSSVFNIQAGSSISVYSGSWSVDNKATLYKVAPPDPTGTWIANFSIPIAAFGSRIEIWHDAKYIDIKTGHIIVTGEQCTNFPGTDGKEKIIIRKEGTVHFDKCTFADIKIACEVENGITFIRDTKPTVIFRECTFPTGDWSSTAIVNYVDYDAGTLVDFFPNSAGFARLICQDCRTSGDISNTFIDGAPHAVKGYSNITYTKRYAFGAATPYHLSGLPALTNPVTIKIPLNCVVIRVGIIKGPGGGGQAIQKWRIKDGNNVDLVELATTSIFDEANVFSYDIWKKISTDQMRSFTLYADPANFDLGAEGFFVIEYI